MFEDTHFPPQGDSDARASDTRRHMQARNTDSRMAVCRPDFTHKFYPMAPLGRLDVCTRIAYWEVMFMRP